ncbi:MAG TPA: argininosuccinate lyase [Archaeoglobus veneficus]|nr:argininosuccinate lyase [Archaeoglobus veneficus]
MALLRSRLKKKMDKLALEFSSSIDSDRNIFYYDILVDYAHVLGLLRSNLLSKDEAKEIILALNEVKKKNYKFDNYEDVHEAIEAEVTKITKAALKMHTARSRNDEVATCLRLFARDNILGLMNALLEIRGVIINLAKKNVDALMPGFTHLQYAQPTRLAHHLIAYHDSIERDFFRCKNAFSRINLSPLGSAAFASTSFKLDRYYTAELLGFDDIVENTADAVSNRDFLIECVFIATSVMLNLSRICEELILWSSEFNFVELPDEYASTSSIMPQKKNPDIAELIRAKCGKIIGNLASAMAIYKAMPYNYNRDFQEMNDILYDSLRTAIDSTTLLSRMLERLKFNVEVMEKKAKKGFSTATQIADLLVMKENIPFRIAHKIVGKLVMLNDFTIDRIKEIASNYGYEIKNITKRDIKDALDVVKVVESRKNVGGTAKNEVERMLRIREERLNEDLQFFENLVERIALKLERLYEEIESVVKA